MSRIDYTLDKFLYEVMGDNFIQEIYKRFVDLEIEENESGDIEDLSLVLRDDVYIYHFNTKDKYVTISPITSANMIALENAVEDYVASDFDHANYTDVRLPKDFIEKLKEFAKQYDYKQMNEIRSKYKNFNNIYNLERELSELYTSNKDKFMKALGDWYRGTRYVKKYSSENSVNNFVMSFENKLAKFEIHSYDKSIRLINEERFYLLDDDDLYNLVISDEGFDKYLEFQESINLNSKENATTNNK